MQPFIHELNLFYDNFSDQLYSKIVSMKNNLATFQPVVIYDLDELITQNQHQDVNIPNIEDIHMNYLNAECDMMSTEVLHFESRFECGNLRKVEQVRNKHAFFK